MNYKTFIGQLTAIGPRYAENEILTANLIEKTLQENSIPFVSQPFSTDVPVCTRAELTVDGEHIPCMGSSMVSGSIPDGKYLISHFGFSGDTPYNIAYSPLTDAISVVDHLAVPSVTISRNDVVKIVMAKDVSGKVDVERRTIATKNILVGNTTNPTAVVFAHFDSIVGQGAVDNAGSVAVVMSCVLANPHLLTTTLFIFSGNEEIAYDDYRLSGYGFRVFESEYGELLRKATQILVLDGVGMGTPTFAQTQLDWVLQLKMLDSVRDKVHWMKNDQPVVMRYFHTTNDRAEILDGAFLLQAEKLLIEKLEK